MKQDHIRNFCIIAHVDHGKSSLSSRILEIAGNLGRGPQKVALSIARGEEISQSSAIADQKERIELLDTLSVEQERGITVKASTASML